MRHGGQRATRPEKGKRTVRHLLDPPGQDQSRFVDLSRSSLAFSFGRFCRRWRNLSENGKSKITGDEYDVETTHSIPVHLPAGLRRAHPPNGPATLLSPCFPAQRQIPGRLLVTRSPPPVSDYPHVETNMFVSMIAPQINAKLAERASFSSAFQNPGAARILEIFLSKIFLSKMSGSNGREDRKIKDRKIFSAWASRLRSLFFPAQSGIKSAPHRS